MNINTKLLREALTSLRPIVGTRQTIPVLSCVKLECEANKLTISATNLDCWKSVIVECNGDLPMSCINLAQFLIILGDGETTQLEVVKKSLEVRYGKSVFRVGIIKPEEFPASRKDDEMTHAGLNCQDVADGVEAVSWAASRDNTRINLCSTHIYSTPKLFTCESADGRNGAFFDRALICPAMNLLIPSAFSKEFAEALKHKDAVFSYSDRAVMVTHEKGMVWFKQVDAKYPDYTSRHGYKTTELGTLNVKALQFVVDQCCALADPNLTPAISLTFSKEGLRVQFTGSRESSVDKMINGEFKDCETKANGNGLSSCLQGLGASECSVACEGDGTGPSNFLSFRNGDLLVVSMAMRPTPN